MFHSDPNASCGQCREQGIPLEEPERFFFRPPHGRKVPLLPLPVVG